MLRFQDLIQKLIISRKHINILVFFSLIKSLHKNNFIDFYSFLARRKSKVEFPINNKKEIETYYQKYKEEFGTIQQAVSFFQLLSEKMHENLVQKIEIKDTANTIENLSKYLYEIRSKFVHEANLVLSMSNNVTVGKKDNKVVVCKMSINDLMSFFEDGLISFFSEYE